MSLSTVPIPDDAVVRAVHALRVQPLPQGAYQARRSACMESNMSYHKDTYEVLTREVYNERVCHPTDIYLDRLWHTLDRYRPDIDAFVAALERAMQRCNYEIERYPTDYANVNQCRDYIKRDRAWLDKLPGISQRCEENEKKNNEIMARLEELMQQSRDSKVVEIEVVERKRDPVQTVLWEESA